MENVTYNYFLQRVAEKLNDGMKKRKREAEAVLDSQSLYQINARIESLRSRLLKIIGFDFEKCDLQPRVNDIIHMGEYVIEKILIQSLTGYFVPVHIYKPAADTQCKYPAVLVAMGHYIEGKNLPENQIFCANLAMQGYVVLTFDPIFQGERDVFPENKERHAEKDKWVVAQHMMGAMQGYLLGDQLIKYYLWDGIRAIDYLCTREDVDENSIGCCGQSGGGTQTAYLSAIDSRIKAAVPIQYITSVEDDLKINGVGDAEQATYGLMKERIDKADLLWMFAPRPMLINASLKDIFPLEGTVKVAEELKRLYGVFGAEDRVKLAEVDTEHYLAKETREAAYLWFNKWLRKETGFRREKEIRILDSVQLDCGYGKCNSLTVLDMNRTALEEALKQHQKASGRAHLQLKLKDFLTNVYRDNYTINTIDRHNTGSGITRELFNIYTGNNYEAFCELYMKQENARLLFVLDMNRMLGEDEINEYLSTGYNVLSIKPFGAYYTMGKTQFFYDMQSMVAHCIFADGNDLLSIRVNEVLCCFDYIRNSRKIDYPVTMLGIGQGAILSLVSSLYEDEIEKVLSVNMLTSYKSLFEHKNYFINESDVICGFLSRFDICDLVSASCAKNITLINPVDGQGNCCSTEYAEKEYSGAITDHDGKLRIAVLDNAVEELNKELR